MEIREARSPPREDLAVQNSMAAKENTIGGSGKDEANFSL
jgi:hypothetical protein